MRSTCAGSSVLGLLLLLQPISLSAEEPNNTFADSTILAPGTLAVSDELGVSFGGFPDTYLGAFGLFGEPIAEDDDSSIYGDGFASGLTGVPVNPNGTISFTVTGFDDFFFEGSHGEEGDYIAYVDVYDLFGDPVESFGVEGSLVPGSYDEYSFSDFNWFNGSYDVNIDNALAVVGGDVDFFTFTGLTAGALFTAETMSLGSIDTTLGWFDDGGTLLEFDEDSGVGFLSRLEGTIPASGQLTFAVTGHGDNDFVGTHYEENVYDLQLTVQGISPPGDFDTDGDVDGFDLTHPTLGWEARYGVDLTGEEFLTWQRNVGGGVAAVAAPEPGSCMLVLLCLSVWQSLGSRHFYSSR